MKALSFSRNLTLYGKIQNQTGNNIENKRPRRLIPPLLINKPPKNGNIKPHQLNYKNNSDNEAYPINQFKEENSNQDF